MSRESEGQPKFKRYDCVTKTGGDYTYSGVVVSVYEKVRGDIRYVVEDCRGLNFIFNEGSLQPVLNVADWRVWLEDLRDPRPVYKTTTMS